jgi:hypothetical protein
MVCDTRILLIASVRMKVQDGSGPGQDACRCSCRPHLCCWLGWVGSGPSVLVAAWTSAKRRDTDASAPARNDPTLSTVITGP